METKKLVIVGTLFLLLIVLVIIFFRMGDGERTELPPPLPTQVDSSEKPKESTTIVLFFPSDKDSLLHREKRKIVKGTSPSKQAKLIIQELFNGSQEGFISPFPPETTLREVYVTEDGTAYVDFSRDIKEKHLSGSSAEIATIYSVVNSLSHNLKPIKRVFILIDGGERQTLGGHIDLTKPFSPQPDLVAK